MGEQSVQSTTGGVKPMSIQGRMAHDTERMRGMTEAERAWRHQWLKDQSLTAREPIYMSKESPTLMNPFRRAYRWPLNQLEKLMAPVVGPTAAKVVRYYGGKILIGVYAAWVVAYYVNYNTNTWINKTGWRMTTNRPITFPGEEGFPSLPKKQPRDYYDRGFQGSIFGQKNDNGREFLPDDDIPINFGR